MIGTLATVRLAKGHRFKAMLLHRDDVRHFAVRLLRRVSVEAWPEGIVVHGFSLSTRPLPLSREGYAAVAEES